MVKHLPASAEDMGSIQDPGRSHMLRGNKAHMTQLLSPRCRAHKLLLLKPPHPGAHTVQSGKPPQSSSCSVTKSCTALWDPMDCSTPGFPVLHHLPEFAQTHVQSVDDAIQPSHPLSSPSLPAFNLSQHQGLFQWGQLFTSSDQSIGASVAATVLPVNIQG